MMKTCKICGLVGEDDLFCKNRLRCISCWKRASHAYYIANKERTEEYKERYYEQNKEKIWADKKAYYQRNREEKTAKQRAIYAANKDRENTRSRARRKAIRRGEKGCLPLFRLRIGCLVREALRRGGYTKRSRAGNILGAPYEDVAAFLGPRPHPDAQIDHVCPPSEGKTEEEITKLHHYTNLQWLTPEQNLAKSNRWTPEGAALCLALLGREWVTSS